VGTIVYKTASVACVTPTLTLIVYEYQIGVLLYIFETNIRTTSYHAETALIFPEEGKCNIPSTQYDLTLIFHLPSMKY
jgi:hypothetical protein